MHSGVRLLFTGFEPFGRFEINPSWEAAKMIADESGADVAARRLCVDYHGARRQLIKILDELQPVACLCMGLAPGDAFRLERVARKVPQFHELSGPEQLHGNWPWQPLQDMLSHLDVPWRFSDDAGLFVCESTYWSLLQYAQEKGTPRQCGFLHVPAISDAFPLERTITIVRQICRKLTTEI